MAGYGYYTYPIQNHILVRRRLREKCHIEICVELPSGSHALSHERFTRWTGGLQLHPDVELSYIRGALGYVIFVKRQDIPPVLVPVPAAYNSPPECNPRVPPVGIHQYNVPYDTNCDMYRGRRDYWNYQQSGYHQEDGYEQKDNYQNHHNYQENDYQRRQKNYYEERHEHERYNEFKRSHHESKPSKRRKSHLNDVYGTNYESDDEYHRFNDRYHSRRSYQYRKTHGTDPRVNKCDDTSENAHKSVKKEQNCDETDNVVPTTSPKKTNTNNRKETETFFKSVSGHSAQTTHEVKEVITKTHSSVESKIDNFLIAICEENINEQSKTNQVVLQKSVILDCDNKIDTDLVTTRNDGNKSSASVDDSDKKNTKTNNNTEVNTMKLSKSVESPEEKVLVEQNIVNKTVINSNLLQDESHADNIDTSSSTEEMTRKIDTKESVGSQNVSDNTKNCLKNSTNKDNQNSRNDTTKSMVTNPAILKSNNVNDALLDKRGSDVDVEKELQKLYNDRMDTDSIDNSKSYLDYRPFMDDYRVVDMDLGPVRVKKQKMTDVTTHDLLVQLNGAINEMVTSEDVLITNSDQETGIKDDKTIQLFGQSKTDKTNNYETTNENKATRSVTLDSDSTKHIIKRSQSCTSPTFSTTEKRMQEICLNQKISKKEDGTENSSRPLKRKHLDSGPDRRISEDKRISPSKRTSIDDAKLKDAKRSLLLENNAEEPRSKITTRRASVADVEQLKLKTHKNQHIEESKSKDIKRSSAIVSNEIPKSTIHPRRLSKAEDCEANKVRVSRRSPLVDPNDDSKDNDRKNQVKHVDDKSKGSGETQSKDWKSMYFPNLDKGYTIPKIKNSYSEADKPFRKPIHTIFGGHEGEDAQNNSSNHKSEKSMEPTKTFKTLVNSYKNTVLKQKSTINKSGGKSETNKIPFPVSKQKTKNDVEKSSKAYNHLSNNKSRTTTKTMSKKVCDNKQSRSKSKESDKPATVGKAGQGKRSISEFREKVKKLLSMTDNVSKSNNYRSQKDNDVPKTVSQPANSHKTNNSQNCQSEFDTKQNLVTANTNVPSHETEQKVSTNTELSESVSKSKKNNSSGYPKTERGPRKRYNSVSENESSRIKETVSKVNTQKCPKRSEETKTSLKKSEQSTGSTKVTNSKNIKDHNMKPNSIDASTSLENGKFESSLSKKLENLFSCERNENETSSSLTNNRICKKQSDKNPKMPLELKVQLTYQDCIMARTKMDTLIADTNRTHIKKTDRSISSPENFQVLNETSVNTATSSDESIPLSACSPAELSENGKPSDETLVNTGTQLSVAPIPSSENPQPEPSEHFNSSTKTAIPEDQHLTPVCTDETENNFGISFTTEDLIRICPSPRTEEISECTLTDSEKTADDLINEPAIKKEKSYRPIVISTAVKSECQGNIEKCYPLVLPHFPQLQKVRPTSVENDCSEEAMFMDLPEMSISELFVINVENDSQDVVEIRADIPLIDLTNDGRDERAEETSLFEILDACPTKTEEKITLYRSDETSNTSLEVQAMSASLLPSTILEAVKSKTDQVKMEVDPIKSEISSLSDIPTSDDVTPGAEVESRTNENDINTEEKYISVGTLVENSINSKGGTSVEKTATQNIPNTAVVIGKSEKEQTVSSNQNCSSSLLQNLTVNEACEGHINPNAAIRIIQDVAVVNSQRSEKQVDQSLLVPIVNNEAFMINNQRNENVSVQKAKQDSVIKEILTNSSQEYDNVTPLVITRETTRQNPTNTTSAQVSTQSNPENVNSNQHSQVPLVAVNSIESNRKNTKPVSNYLLKTTIPTTSNVQNAPSYTSVRELVQDREDSGRINQISQHSFAAVGNQMRVNQMYENITPAPVTNAESSSRVQPAQINQFPHQFPNQVPIERNGSSSTAMPNTAKNVLPPFSTIPEQASARTLPSCPPFLNDPLLDWQQFIAECILLLVHNKLINQAYIRYIRSKNFMSMLYEEEIKILERTQEHRRTVYAQSMVTRLSQMNIPYNFPYKPIHVVMSIHRFLQTRENISLLQIYLYLDCLMDKTKSFYLNHPYLRHLYHFVQVNINAIKMKSRQADYSNRGVYVYTPEQRAQLNMQIDFCNMMTRGSSHNLNNACRNPNTKRSRSGVAHQPAVSNNLPMQNQFQNTVPNAPVRLLENFVLSNITQDASNNNSARSTARVPQHPSQNVGCKGPGIYQGQNFVNSAPTQQNMSNNAQNNQMPQLSRFVNQGPSNVSQQQQMISNNVQNSPMHNRQQNSQQNPRRQNSIWADNSILLTHLLSQNASSNPNLLPRSTPTPYATNQVDRSPHRMTCHNSVSRQQFVNNTSSGPHKSLAPSSSSLINSAVQQMMTHTSPRGPTEIDNNFNKTPLSRLGPPVSDNPLATPSQQLSNNMTSTSSLQSDVCMSPRTPVQSTDPETIPTFKIPSKRHPQLRLWRKNSGATSPVITDSSSNSPVSNSAASPVYTSSSSRQNSPFTGNLSNSPCENSQNSPANNGRENISSLPNVQGGHIYAPMPFAPSYLNTEGCSPVSESHGSPSNSISDTSTANERTAVADTGIRTSEATSETASANDVATDETITSESTTSLNEDDDVIDLTYLDDYNNEELIEELDSIVKQEVPDEEEAEVILNQEQFPVACSPSDSGIEGSPTQSEYSELVYIGRSCICDKPAEYICGCRMVMYCSNTCQSKDWNRHKKICLRLAHR